MSKPTKKPTPPFLRVRFPDGTTTDKLLEDHEHTLAETDPTLARMTEDAPMSSAAAQVRIAERARVLVAASVQKAKQRKGQTQVAAARRAKLSPLMKACLAAEKALGRAATDKQIDEWLVDKQGQGSRKTGNIGRAREEMRKRLGT